MGGFGGGWLEQLCEAVAGRVVGRPLPGSAELPGAARRPEEAHRRRGGALPRVHFDRAGSASVGSMTRETMTVMSSVGRQPQVRLVVEPCNLYGSRWRACSPDTDASQGAAASSWPDAHHACAAPPVPRSLPPRCLPCQMPHHCVSLHTYSHAKTKRS